MSDPARFGSDFSSVRIPTGGEAGDAAQNVDATASQRGDDTYFSQDQYDPGSEGGERLIAHELAYVVQPGDQAAAAAGDATGDLRSAAAAGDWLGSVDGEAVIARTRALSPADKAALKSGDTGDTYDALHRRIMRMLDTGQALEYLSILGGLDLRWKLRWLDEGGKLDELAPHQWQRLVGYASPQTLDLLRQYPAGYRSFLRNAPPEMIPPWDRLSGLVDGTWSGSATDVRNAVLSLSPDQKARVRADDPKVARILERSGSAAEKYRVVAYLDFKLERAIYWLSTQRVLPALTPHQWSQLLSEATRADHDELVGWAELWALVQTHCPASILQVTRQNSDPAAAATAFDDPVQIDTLFATLGPAGFLANATRDAAAVDAVYRKVQAKAKVLPTVEGLPAGAQMGAATQANLRAWFFTPASTDAECTKMFEQRFRVPTTGTGTYDHTRTAAARLQPLTKPGLSQLWTVCEALPPAHVETNPRLLNILRDQNNGPGDACYAGPGTGGQGDILMGYRGDAELGQDVYQAGGPGPGAPAVDMPMLTATLRHELGHAVDSQLRGGTVARAPGT